MKKYVSILMLFVALLVTNVCYSQDFSNDPNQGGNFTGYYNSRFSSGDYKIIKGTVYYKSNVATITSIAFGGITSDSTPGNVSVGSNADFATTLFIDGFKRVNGRYNYTYSLCTTSENGEVYQKSDNMNSYVEGDQFILQFAYNTSSLKSGTSPTIFHMSFIVKDNFSKAIIQGYYKFTQLP